MARPRVSPVQPGQVKQPRAASTVEHGWDPVFEDKDFRDPDGDPDYAAIALEYAIQVVDGKLGRMTGHYERAHCQRQLDDIERWPGQDGPYRYRPELGARLCRFISRFTHIRGPLAGQRIELEPHQVFRLMVVYSWERLETLARQRELWRRRFNQVVETMARGNAKSTILAAQCLWHLGPDGESGPEVVSAASTAKQAKRVILEMAKTLAKHQPAFLSHWNIYPQQYEIKAPDVDGAMYLVSNDTDGQTDGLGVHFAAVDELHAHKGRDPWESLKGSMGKRLNPIIWGTTTRGHNMAGIYWELDHKAQAVLDRKVKDEKFAAFIYSCDHQDDVTLLGEDDDDPEPIEKRARLLEKANPNIGVSVLMPDLESELVDAITFPSQRATLMAKKANLWYAVEGRFLDMQKWIHLQANPCPSWEELRGCRVWIGIDLANVEDLFAVVYLFQLPDGRYLIRSRFWTNTVAAGSTAAGKANYQGWADGGHLELVKAGHIDWEVIKPRLQADREMYSVQSWNLDINGHHSLTAWMARKNWDMDRVHKWAQTFANYDGPMKALERDLIGGKLLHDGSPVLTWNATNLCAERDRFGHLRPVKESDADKIDGMCGLLMARKAMLDADEQAHDENDYADLEPEEIDF